MIFAKILREVSVFGLRENYIIEEKSMGREILHPDCLRQPQVSLVRKYIFIEKGRSYR